MLADERPDLRTVHFLHTPFAAPDIWPCCPTTSGPSCSTAWPDTRPAVSTATSGSRLAACYAAAGRRAPRTFVAPLGPDAGVLGDEAATPECAAAAARCGPRWGASHHRPDRPHGALEEHRAGDARLRGAADRAPQWHGQVVHVAFAYPSRQGLAEYLAYAADVEHTAERINHAFGAAASGADHGWTPIVLSVEDDRARSLAALTLSDVLLVNPVRDGLNLVAKEGPLLNAADGVLVLSHQAGAWEELALAGGGALGSIPSTSPARPTPCTPLSSWARPTPGRAAALAPVRGGRRPTGGPTSWPPLDLERRRPRRRRRRPAGAAAPRRRGAAHRQVRGRGNRRRALGVDGGDPHRREWPTVVATQVLQGGEGGQVADVVAEGGRRTSGWARASCSATSAGRRFPCPRRAGGAARVRAVPRRPRGRAPRAGVR